MSTPHADRERAENEAATWLVLLAETPDDADLRARFEAWRTSSAVNAELWKRTARAYELAGKTEPTHRPHWAGYAEPRARASPAKGVAPARDRATTLSRRGQWTKALAALAALFVLAIIAPEALVRLQADAITAAAELETLTLEDGSKINLAPKSAIAVDLSGAARRVRLIRGEAYFDVAPDPARPFEVRTRAAAVTVLGTAFDVRLDGDGGAVAVERGHVRVDAGGRSARLSAGDRVTLNRAGIMSRDAIDPSDVSGRSRGELIVRDRPASEIVSALRPYFRGLIVVVDDDFADWRVTGRYNLREPIATLEALARQRGATVRELSPYLIIVSAR